MIAFTICSRNFIGYAEALRYSINKNHPDARFYLVLCDIDDGLDRFSFPFPIVLMEELEISGLAMMIDRYNITELNTALKPHAFMYIFHKHPGAEVLYFDPDIYVTSRLVELESALQSGVDCVLTPHILEPSEYADMDDSRFLNYGIYNLGFCALRDTPDVRRVVAWWGRRLQEHCLIDLQNGLFVDQKWADYFPAFIPKTEILRHPGYNVAYWNLSQRRITLHAGSWFVNRVPLRFFHFSGNRIEDENCFSRHSRQFTLENTPNIDLLLREYRELVLRSGHAYYSSFDFAYNWNGTSEFNEHTPEDKRKPLSRDYKPHLPLLRSRDIENFNSLREFNNNGAAARLAIEDKTIPGNSAFVCDGYCTICDKERSFQVSQMYASSTLADGRIIPNWREHLNCLNCGTVNRSRGALKILEQEFIVGGEKVYITEQVTELYAVLKQKWPTLVGSEYLKECSFPGEYVDGIRHEDLTNLSFEDETFDLVLSFDVLEHIADYRLALREIFRCLSAGGRLLFTVPFSYSHETEVTRAVITASGEIEHLMSPEYHGNPVDQEMGSLCYRYFGWSILRDLEEAGFVDAEVISYWSSLLKNLGDPQFAITASKPYSH